MSKLLTTFVILTVLAGCGGGGFVPPGAPDMKLRLATWNLYYGADLGDAVLAAESGDPEAILAAVSAAYAQVQATNFPQRAEVIADEIVAQRLDLVGLQEAALWRTQSPSDTFSGEPTPAEDVALDFVDVLLAALAARGVTYEVAVALETFDAELPRLDEFSELQDVRLTDREVILVRRTSDPDDPGVLVEDTASGLYAVHLALPSGLEIPQGWVAVDATFRGQPFRFVSTHLEADYEDVRLAQADELLSGPAAGPGPVWVVGDFNTDAHARGTGGAPAYDLLTGGTLSDAFDGWVMAEAAGTATRGAGLDDPLDVLVERIDLILHGAAASFAIDDVGFLGAGAESFVGGLWPSDHAGVVVTLEALEPAGP